MGRVFNIHEEITNLADNISVQLQLYRKTKLINDKIESY